MGTADLREPEGAECLLVTLVSVEEEYGSSLLARSLYCVVDGMVFCLLRYAK